VVWVERVSRSLGTSGPLAAHSRPDVRTPLAGGYTIRFDMAQGASWPWGRQDWIAFRQSGDDRAAQRPAWPTVAFKLLIKSDLRGSGDSQAIEAESGCQFVRISCRTLSSRGILILGSGAICRRFQSFEFLRYGTVTGFTELRQRPMPGSGTARTFSVSPGQSPRVAYRVR